MTLLKAVCSLTLLCVVVSGLPTGVSDIGSPRTGKNWLTPYVRLISSVIPSDEAAALVPGQAERATRDARSSESTTTKPRPATQEKTASSCPSFVLNHRGKKVPLVKPTSGNIYKNKSDGDPVKYAAAAAARAAVTAHSGGRHNGSVLVSVSNPRSRGRPQLAAGKRRLDVCAAVWPANPPQQRTEVDELFAFFSTYEVPQPTKATTPLPPSASGSRPGTPSPAVEPVVAEAECNLPPPYQNDRYDWLEVLAAHGGLPGCVNSTHEPPPQMPAAVLNDTCERPLPDNFTSEVLYTYMQSDLRNFYRDETAKLRFPGKPNQFLDVRGLLVWTSPPEDGNVYVIEYFYDDSGLWLYIPDHTCRFVDTATLVCSTRQVCWCKDGKETCLAVQGLPGNLLATLVGGG